MINDLDLDAKLEADRIIAKNEGAIFYVRMQGRDVSIVWAGQVDNIVTAIYTAMENDETYSLFEAVDAALDAFYNDNQKAIDEMYAIQEE